MREVVNFAVGKLLGPALGMVRRGALAPFMVLVLLICHGVFGAVHQTMSAETALVPPAEGHLIYLIYIAPSQVAHGESEDRGELAQDLLLPSFLMNSGVDEGVWNGATDALRHVALLLFTVSMFSSGCLFKDGRRGRGTPLHTSPSRKPSVGVRLQRPSRPTISDLQVFRL